MLGRRVAMGIVGSGSVLRPHESYNPTLHRAKEAMLHSTPVADLKAHPKLKFFEPPSRVPKRGKQPLEACIRAFDIKQGSIHSFDGPNLPSLAHTLLVPKRGAKVKVQGSTHTESSDSEPFFLKNNKARSLVRAG
ncbi:hypothetical protein FA13DRAFT_1281993 [Coprinellus micaceus]|uniref:Uncharacterized protein n=1 Tax=Coprinellus micaceus TaxID=71717 RepID=A0A4Y7R8Y6_COPMI|nr:hypothetical protein FA13DRAFT_1281993 [Coprinellus micaceus]